MRSTNQTKLVEKLKSGESFKEACKALEIPRGTMYGMRKRIATAHPELTKQLYEDSKHGNTKVGGKAQQEMFSELEPMKEPKAEYTIDPIWLAKFLREWVKND